jgi:hypothetical protein
MTQLNYLFVQKTKQKNGKIRKPEVFFQRKVSRLFFLFQEKEDQIKKNTVV